MGLGRDDRFDTTLIVVRQDGQDIAWNGNIRNLTFNTTTMQWEAQVPAASSGGSTGGLTNTELRATSVPISGTVTANTGLTQPLTDAQLRLSAVPVSLASTTITNTVAVSGALTDTQIRATALPVSLSSTTVTNSVTVKADAAINQTSAFKVDGSAVIQPVSGSVSVSNFPATQAVSATALPLPTGAATETTTAAINTKIPAGLTVTANRLQVELPAGGTGLTNTELRATAVPVSLTSTTITGSVSTNATLSAETTKVIGTVNLSAGQTVTSNIGTTNGLALDATLTGGTAKAILRTAAKGTTVAGDATSTAFDANTQALDVSVKGTVATGGLTDTQIRATALPVSLASTTVTNTVAVSGALTDTQLRATAVPVSGTVSANATLTAETTKVIGTINLSAAQTLATVTTVSAVTAITNALPAGTNSIGTTQPPAITKGTQGTIGVTTQDLKDAGRNAVHYYMVIPVLASATDTLQSLTGTKGGATVLATTTPAVVTAGKALRVTRLAATYVATATSGYGIARLRFNTAGVVAITSPVAATITIGAGTPAAANSVGTGEATLTDGWEFPAGTGVGVSVQGFAAATATAVGYMHVSITGYEY